MTPDPALSEALRRLAFRPGGMPLVGVSGAQGSGKTTLARAVAARIGAACLSLDDVYLSAAERMALAESVHPLFRTRGPPGTHDLALLSGTLDALSRAKPGDRTALPAFDKLADDRRPPDDWPMFEGRPSAIVIDGWCLGATAQAAEDVADPINALEEEADPDGVWRSHVNAQLAGPYANLFNRFDGFLHLVAPDFGVVQGWRTEQEAGLLGNAVPEARKAQLARFIQHFERITRHMLGGGRRPGVVAHLGPDRGLLGPPRESR